MKGKDDHWAPFEVRVDGLSRFALRDETRARGVAQSLARQERKPTQVYDTDARRYIAMFDRDGEPLEVTDAC